MPVVGLNLNKILMAVGDIILNEIKKQASLNKEYALGITNLASFIAS